MRGSAPLTPEYTTNLTALPLIDSIRWLRRAATSSIAFIAQRAEIVPDSLAALGPWDYVVSMQASHRSLGRAGATEHACKAVTLKYLET